MESNDQKEKITDDMVISEWKSMLNVFHTTIAGNPPAENIKEELMALQDAAKQSVLLTPRQVGGIYERCQNYINGTYGKGLSHLA
jgi:hypothetical protein